MENVSIYSRKMAQCYLATWLALNVKIHILMSSKSLDFKIRSNFIEQDMYFVSSSQGPLRRFLVECSSSYLANPTCLIVTRKITPGPFVFVVNKNNTFFFLIIVGFTLVPESEMKKYIHTCVYMLCVYSRGQRTRQRKCP